jgi:hypothetical protein
MLPWLGISERDGKGEKGWSSGAEEATVLVDVTGDPPPLLIGGAEEGGDSRGELERLMGSASGR